MSIETTGRARKKGEARALIVIAARELFAKNGYAGASIRDIAKRAQVAESVVFRSFGTKQNLFEESVVQPYRDFMAAYIEDWRSASEDATAWTNPEIMGRFAASLFDLVSHNRELLLALAAVELYSDEASDLGYPESPLSAGLELLYDFASPSFESREMAPDVDIKFFFRCVVGIVMSLVLFDSWLFPQGEGHPTPDQMIDQIVKIYMYGLEKR